MTHNFSNFFISSPEPKSQVSFSDQNLSVVGGRCHPCWRRCCCCRKLFTFSSFSPTTGSISTKLGTKHPWVKVQMKSPTLFQVDNYAIAKIHWRNLKKIFFSRITGPISTKLGTKHPWVKGIKFCSNEGPRPFPRGDNYEISKIPWQNLTNLLLKNHLTNFNQTFHSASLGEGDSGLFKWRTIQFSWSK